MTSLLRRSPIALILVLMLALGAAACGDDGDSDSASGPSDAAGVEVSGEQGSKPVVELPGGDPPTELKVVDLIEGDGAEIPEDSTVTTNYLGVSWLNEGQEFDSSWDRGAPATFGLNQVISGWTEGIPGMREGGRRLLIIPPDQAYGPDSPTPAIAANDTLVFVIDMVEAQ